MITLLTAWIQAKYENLTDYIFLATLIIDIKIIMVIAGYLGLDPKLF